MKIYDNTSFTVGYFAPFDKTGLAERLDEKFKDRENVVIIKYDDSQPNDYANPFEIINCGDDRCDVFYIGKNTPKKLAKEIINGLNAMRISWAKEQKDGTWKGRDYIAPLQKIYEANSENGFDAVINSLTDAAQARAAAYVLEGENAATVTIEDVEPTDTEGHCYDFTGCIGGMLVDFIHNSLYSNRSDVFCVYETFVLNKFARLDD